MIFQKWKQSTFVQNITRVFGVKSLVLLLGMISSIISARVLGPEGKGIYAVAATLTGIGVQFGNLGMHSSNTYFLSKDRKILPAIVGNSIVITLLVALVSGVVLAVLLFFSHLVTIHGVLLVLAFIGIPLQLYNMYQENYFVALGRIKEYSMLEMMNGSLYPAFFIVTAVLNGWNMMPETATVLSISGTLIVLIVGAVWLKVEINEKMYFDIKLLRETLPFGFKSYISCIVTYLVLRADVLMIDVLVNKTQTGLYSLAVNLADIVNMIAVSVSMLLFPKLSGMSGSEERRKFIYKVLKYMALVMLGLVVGATLFSGMAILWVYGDDYRESIPVFQILMPGIFFWSLSSLLFNYFSSENKIGINIYSSAIGLCANLILNGLLIPEYGIQGAAIASTISYALIFVFLVYYLRKTGEDHEKAKEK